MTHSIRFTTFPGLMGPHKILASSGFRLTFGKFFESHEQKKVGCPPPRSLNSQNMVDITLILKDHHPRFMCDKIFEDLEQNSWIVKERMIAHRRIFDLFFTIM